jgi:hypothetical protein
VQNIDSLMKAMVVREPAVAAGVANLAAEKHAKAAA